MENTTFDDVVFNLSTTPSPIEPPVAGSILVGILLLLLVIVTLAGNIMTISAFISNVLLKQKPSNLLLLSLSCCDLVVGATGLPVAAIHTGLGYWPLGKAACVTFAFFSVVGVSAGMYTVTAVSLDRYFLVSREYPAYLKLQSSRNVKLTIAAAWTVALLIGSCEAILWLVGDYSSVDYSRECLSPVRSDPRFILVIFILLFVIPFFVILVSTLRFSMLLRRRLRKRKGPRRRSVDVVNNRLVHPKDADKDPPTVASSTLMSSESPSEMETTEFSSTPNSHQQPPLSPGGAVEPRRPLKRKTMDASWRKKSFFGLGDGSLGGAGSFSRAKVRRRYVKPAVRLAILLGAFALCTLPYPIFIVLSKGSDCDDCISRQVRNHLSNLLLSNSGLNPFLYAVMHRKIREYFKMKLTCNRKCC
ncbi:muscarinic acetylcholine receptor DM1-like [Patiria miniata]|uniref:G-protein coupled receptors family 1 profile domain-containing protein n=1 Tax=Patiria miniata TaxID=46514 RepID=A0A914ATT3_PATMI|nr:muscarinic acetylcholine receptor DM1-like [Patiria miniata]